MIILWKSFEGCKLCQAAVLYTTVEIFLIMSETKKETSHWFLFTYQILM